jgi:hypothetical protein
MKLMIKHSVKITHLLLLVVMLLSACDLERLPYDSVVNEGMSIGDAESVTRGTYAKMKEEYYYKTIHQVGEYGGDNVSLSGTTSDALFNFYRYTRIADSYYTSRVWLFTYQMIGNINSVLPVLETYEASESEREVVDHLIGENLLLRAFIYFNCCNIFGRPYMDANGAANNPGIPIKTTADINYFPQRASVADVYEQIIKDATLAAQKMKRNTAAPKNNNYVSREVAWAFLSRIYLYMGQMDKAGAYADSVITSGRYSLLQSDQYVKYPQHVPESNTETIWCIRMMKDTDFEKYNMDFYSVGSLYSMIDEIGWGEMYPSESYLSLLRENPSDLRHGFIDNQLHPAGGLWMVYVNANEAANTWNYVMKDVVQEGDDYRITQDPGSYTNPIVQKETTPNGNTQYYVSGTTTGNPRYNVWIEPKLEDRNGYPKRYILKASYQEQQSQLYSPVLFRLSEMYLTRAESRYYQGETNGAIDDLNVIRSRAQIPERPYTSGATVLKWILDERRLELAWEAQRKYDIFRNQETLDRKYPGSHLGGSPVLTTLLPSDPRVVEFIPKSEIDAYPIPLEQNP